MRGSAASPAKPREPPATASTASEAYFHPHFDLGRGVGGRVTTAPNRRMRLVALGLARIRSWVLGPAARGILKSVTAKTGPTLLTGTRICLGGTSIRSDVYTGAPTSEDHLRGRRVHADRRHPNGLRAVAAPGVSASRAPVSGTIAILLQHARQLRAEYNPDLPQGCVWASCDRNGPARLRRCAVRDLAEPLCFLQSGPVAFVHTLVA